MLLTLISPVAVKRKSREMTMTKFDSAEIPISKRAPFSAKPPMVISQDDARQGPLGRRMLYVLCFQIAGAIFANALVFTYFALLHASG